MERIDTALGYVSGRNEVIVELTESDVDADPGTVIETFVLRDLEPFASGGGIESSIWVYRPEVLAGHRYWLVAKSTDPLTSLSRWHVNDTGDYGMVGGRDYGIATTAASSTPRSGGK